MRNVVFRWSTAAVLTVGLLTGCGSGGGGSAPAAPVQPPPPPEIVLSVATVEAERIVLSWVVDDLYPNQAYAVTVDGDPYDLARNRGYTFDALPDRHYCFTVVVGQLLSALGRFTAAGPTSNKVCVSTPRLPPLEGGWTVSDAGLGSGGYPAIARRNADGSPLAACDADPYWLPPWRSVFRILDHVTPAPTLTYAGDACAAAALLPNPVLGDFRVGALTLNDPVLTYRVASWRQNDWWLSTDQTIAPDADRSAVSIALDASDRPQVLYGRAGSAYWSRLDENGQFTVPERVADGVVGWRSLAVAADGTSYALLAVGPRIDVLRRAPSGAWTPVFSSEGAQGPTYLRGSGSIVAPAGGGIRVAYARAAGAATMGIGYVEWPGGNAPWTEAIVDPATSVTTPAIAVDPSGAPLIAYGGSGDDLRLARRVAGVWSTVLVDALGALARRTDVEVGPDGVVHILYSDENGPTKWARRAPP